MDQVRTQDIHKILDEQKYLLKCINLGFKENQEMLLDPSVSPFGEFSGDLLECSVAKTHELSLDPQPSYVAPL